MVSVQTICDTNTLDVSRKADIRGYHILYMERLIAVRPDLGIAHRQ